MTATVIRLPRRSGSLPAQLAPGQLATEAEDRALRAELRRARVRISQLESSLTDALRDNVLHFERARAAEQRLAEFIADREPSEIA